MSPGQYSYSPNIFLSKCMWEQHGLLFECKKCQQSASPLSLLVFKPWTCHDVWGKPALLPPICAFQQWALGVTWCQWGLMSVILVFPHNLQASIQRGTRHGRLPHPQKHLLLFLNPQLHFERRHSLISFPFSSSFVCNIWDAVWTFPLLEKSGEWWWLRKQGLMIENLGFQGKLYTDQIPVPCQLAETNDRGFWHRQA